MFGSVPGASVVHDETSALNPQSPYAAAKAAAHLLCRSYRESYDLRIACGILFNHESHRRGKQFLTRKVVDHLHALRAGGERRPLDAREPEGAARLGLRAGLRRRDDLDPPPGRRSAACPTRRATTATTSLGTGRLHHVWELVDRAFALAGFELAWSLDGADPLAWRAAFADSGEPAVVVDPAFMRPSDPLAIPADPSLIEEDLGWQPRPGLDVFLEDMLAAAPASLQP